MVPPSQHLLFGFIKWDSIRHIIDNGVIFLITVNFFPWYVMIPVVLSRIIFSVLSTKVSQELTLVRRMAGAMNETGF